MRSANVIGHVRRARRGDAELGRQARDVHQQDLPVLSHHHVTAGCAEGTLAEVAAASGAPPTGPPAHGSRPGSGSSSRAPSPTARTTRSDSRSGRSTCGRPRSGSLTVAVTPSTSLISRWALGRHTMSGDRGRVPAGRQRPLGRRGSGEGSARSARRDQEDQRREGDDRHQPTHARESSSRSSGAGVGPRHHRLSSAPERGTGRPWGEWIGRERR